MPRRRWSDISAEHQVLAKEFRRSVTKGTPAEVCLSRLPRSDEGKIALNLLAAIVIVHECGLSPKPAAEVNLSDHTRMHQRIENLYSPARDVSRTPRPRQRPVAAQDSTSMSAIHICIFLPCQDSPSKEQRVSEILARAAVMNETIGSTGLGCETVLLHARSNTERMAQFQALDSITCDCKTHEEACCLAPRCQTSMLGQPFHCCSDACLERRPAFAILFDCPANRPGSFCADVLMPIARVVRHAVFILLSEAEVYQHRGELLSFFKGIMQASKFEVSGVEEYDFDAASPHDLGIRNSWAQTNYALLEDYEAWRGRRAPMGLEPVDIGYLGVVDTWRLHQNCWLDGICMGASWTPRRLPRECWGCLTMLYFHSQGGQSSDPLEQVEAIACDVCQRLSSSKSSCMVRLIYVEAAVRRLSNGYGTERAWYDQPDQVASVVDILDDASFLQARSRGVSLINAIAEELADLNNVPFEQVGRFLLVHSSSQGTVLAQSVAISLATQARPVHLATVGFVAHTSFGGHIAERPPPVPQSMREPAGPDVSINILAGTMDSTFSPYLVVSSAKVLRECGWRVRLAFANMEHNCCNMDNSDDEAKQWAFGRIVELLDARAKQWRVAA